MQPLSSTEEKKVILTLSWPLLMPGIAWTGMAPGIGKITAIVFDVEKYRRAGI